MGEPITKDAVESKADGSADETKPSVNWADPSVPIGDAPPLPRWPVVLLFSMWVASIAFLVVMMFAFSGGIAG